MGLLDWMWGKRKLKPADPVFLDDVTIDGQPGEKALVFGDLESLMRMVEAAEHGPKRPMLYMFQHVALREAAFENHPELIREMSEPPREALALSHFRSKAHMECVRAGMLDIDRLDDDEAREAEDELFRTVAVHPRKRGGLTAHVVAMPAPEHSPEAHFVAIVHRDDEPHEYMQESPSTR